MADMGGKEKRRHSQQHQPVYRFSNASPKPEIFLATPKEGESGGEDRASAEKVQQVKTSSAPLSAKDQAALDELAMLFTIQEDRCLVASAGVEPDSPRAGPVREDSKLSRASLTSSQLAAEASFIYQHINFEVLSKCVPGFVKSNLNKNGRYLPETFILRVNYWRRRRALGEDSTAKRAAKAESTPRPCGNDHQHQQQQQQQQGRPQTPSRALSSSRSPRPQTVSSSRQSNNNNSVVQASSEMTPRKVASESRITLISA